MFKKYNEFLSKNIDNLIQDHQVNIFNDKNISIITSINADHKDNNRLILTTYSSVFVGPLFNYCLRLISNENNTVIAFGQPQMPANEQNLVVNLDLIQSFNFAKFAVNLEKQPELSRYIYSSQLFTDGRSGSRHSSLINASSTQKKEEFDLEQLLKGKQINLELFQVKTEGEQGEAPAQLQEEKKIVDETEAKKADQDQNLINLQQIPDMNKVTQEASEEGLQAPTNFNIQQVLFIHKDFPRFSYLEQKQKQCMYGQLIDDTE